MSSENKKLIWLGVAVVAFALLVAGGLLFFFAPSAKKGGASAPATVGNTAAPKSADPQDYLSAPPPAPAAQAPGSVAGQSGDLIVIYGDKPNLSGQAQGAAGGSAADVGSAAGGQAASSAQPAAAQAAPSAAPSAPTATPAAKATQPAAQAAKPQAAAKPATKKPVASKPQTTTQYWIQAASFTSRTKAEELKDELARKGVSGLITVKELEGKTYYRVRIGPYGTKTEAEGWLGRLKALPGCSAAAVWEAQSKN